MLAFSSLFLSTILLLAVRKCSAVNVNIDRTTCSNLNSNIVQRAFNDMVAMAQVAYDRTVAARDQTSPAGERRVVTNTFNTYFGVTNAADGRPFRLSNVIGVLKDIAGQTFDHLNPSILILCDDTYLTESTIDENGQQLPPGVYQAVNERVTPPVWFQIGMERCRDTSPTGDYVGAMSDEKTNFVTICPRTFSAYTAVSPGAKDQDVSALGQHIEDIRSVSTTLFHELLHLMYPEFMARQGEADGFQECAQLRRTNVGDTIRMPDCIALYAFSLYMTGNDWSSGYPVVNPTQ